MSGKNQPSFIGLESQLLQCTHFKPESNCEGLKENNVYDISMTLLPDLDQTLATSYTRPTFGLSFKEVQFLNVRACRFSYSFLPAIICLRTPFTSHNIVKEVSSIATQTVL